MYILLFLATTAHAFEVHPDCGTSQRKWPSSALDLSINTASISTSSSLHGATEDAVDEWDESRVPGSSFATTTGNFFDSVVNKSDNINSISATFDDFASCAPFSIFAAVPNYVWIRGDECFLGIGGDFVEVDIVLNGCFTYRSSLDWYDFEDSNARSDVYNIEKELLAPIGLAAGLLTYGEFSGATASRSDNFGVPHTMSSNFDGGSVISEGGMGADRHYLVNEDDREGLRQLYSASSNNGHDVAIQSYTFPDEAGQLNQCDKGLTRPDPFRDLGDAAVAEGRSRDECPTGANNQTNLPIIPLRVYQGASLDVAFSLLNLGSGSESGVDVRYSLVPNSTGTTYDFYNTGFSLAPDLPMEHTETLTIPIDATPGVYTLMAEIDYDDEITEIDETVSGVEFNNTAAWNRKIEVVELPSCGSCSSGHTSGAGLMCVLAGLGAIVRRRGR